MNQTEKITRTSYITLHLPDGKTFDGVIIADHGGTIQVMPKGCSINFNLPKDEIEIIGKETGPEMPRYIMDMPNVTRNKMTRQALARWAA